MTIEPTDIVEQGRSAWERLRSRRRATRDEWLAVGRAIIIGRTEALESAIQTARLLADVLRQSCSVKI
jgi:hypothetical protein